MTHKQRTKINPSRQGVVNPALTQTAEPGLIELLDSLEHLQSVLCRFTPHDTRAVDISLLTRTALKPISDEISRLFPFRSTRNTRAQLQNWENEGGKTGGF